MRIKRNRNLTEIIKEGDKFYWATDGGVSEHILDHFDYDEYAIDEVNVIVYEKKVDYSLCIGYADSKAFGKYIFFDKKKANKAAKKFAKQRERRHDE